jgi:DNA-binding transcriptional ArsR family regulator
MDEVFKALADPHRRTLLDLLHERDGRTLVELQAHLPMTRFGVMKHLRVLAVCRRERNDGLHDRGVTVQVGRRGRVHA